VTFCDQRLVGFLTVLRVDFFARLTGMCTLHLVAPPEG
jgi:hypothetical protein